MNLLNNIYFLIVAVGLASATGDAFINMYVKTNNKLWFLFGCLGWCTAAIFWSQVLRQQAFTPSVTLFFLGNILAACAIGYFFFGDRVSASQWVWIVVAVVALVLITKTGH